MSKQRGGKPYARRSAQKRRPMGVFIAGAVILAFALLGVALGVGQATRTASVQAAQKGIVGNWVNSKGGELDFHADGSGYIPPTPGIEGYNFSYYFQDPTHFVMNVAGKTMVVEIALGDDKFTWFTADPNVKYDYARAK
jgi:hypothetical protein